MRLTSYCLTSFSLSLAVLACADDTEKGAVGNLGIAGASCLRTPDCRAPLQCLDGLCRDPSAAESDAFGSDAVADASRDAADATYQIDGQNPFADGLDPDVVTAYDARDWEYLDQTSADITPIEVSDTFSDDCGELGVASKWDGTFVGAIDYSVTPNPLTPSTGTLPVNGKLGFEIACIQSKFIVRGTMSGIATVENQGDFPFELKIAGTYDPVGKTLDAKMIDGSVSIYDLIIVYFEGDFDGGIEADEKFHGVWSGHSTGTNQEFITGTAEGDGLWAAAAE